MDLSIIIVNWNSADLLKKCIATIHDGTHGLQYEIIVIDSGSFDGCQEMLWENYPQVRFMQSEENVGFARANNLAFRNSRGRSILFLNPDTEIVGSAICTMHHHLQALPDAGAIGCRLLNADRTIQTSCIQSFPTILNQAFDAEWLRERWPRWSLWGTAPLYETGDAPKPADAIAGACLMLRREVFEKVKLFSEDYFMYAEDVDLSFKIKDAGYQNYYIPAATVVHYGGGSSSEAPSNFSVVMMRESICLFLRKTKGPSYAFAYRISILLCALVRLMFLEAGKFYQRVCSRRRAFDGSLQKWRAVMCWSIFRHKTVKQYV